jgi:hypothetical protein
MPDLPEDVDIDIRPEDIEMQVYRSSGAGGQHINNTSSAVRLIHKPTGIVAPIGRLTISPSISTLKYTFLFFWNLNTSAMCRLSFSC